MKVFASLQRAVRPVTTARSSNLSSSVEKAVDWVKAHRIRGAGMPVHHKSVSSTQEVTGYLIPTLMDVGEDALALELAKWEASVQRPDGSFAAPDGIPYTFDTAQVIRGFLAVLERRPALELNLRRACDYVESQIDSSGKVQTASLDMWQLPGSGMFSEYVNLYVLPPLWYAGRKLHEAKYVRAVERSMDYYRRKSDLTVFKPELHTLSHIFGYMMEALAELGESELARKGLAQAAALQRENGAIPAYPGVEWVCSTGMAQLAAAWLRLGDREPAEKALRYLQLIQNPSGGFYGGYGAGAEYFPAEEISWAPKFFIDAMLLADKQKLAGRQA